jgi:hypothetical protein
MDFAARHNVADEANFSAYCKVTMRFGGFEMGSMRDFS